MSITSGVKTKSALEFGAVSLDFNHPESVSKKSAIQMYHGVEKKKNLIASHPWECSEDAGLTIKSAQ